MIIEGVENKELKKIIEEMKKDGEDLKDFIAKIKSGEIQIETAEIIKEKNLPLIQKKKDMSKDKKKKKNKNNIVENDYEDDYER